MNVRLNRLLHSLLTSVILLLTLSGGFEMTATTTQADVPSNPGTEAAASLGRGPGTFGSGALGVITATHASAVAWRPPAAPATPLDDPTVLVSEPANEWTIGGGLLYWAYRCPGGEIQHDGYLRRMPTHGGKTRTLATLVPFNCANFIRPVADDSGLYYYNQDAGQIEHRSASAPDDPPDVVHAPGEAPGELALDDTHLYWISSTGIYRANKDGSQVTTIATAVNPTSLAVYNFSNSIYWLDDSGLWRVRMDCTPLPCTDREKLVTTQGRHLVVAWSGSPLAIDVHWVESGIPQRIRRYRCVVFPATCATSTLYTAPSDHIWALGQPALGPCPDLTQTCLFWHESYFDMGVGGDSRLRRMPSDGGVAEDIAVNLTDGIGTPPVFTDDLGVYFKGDIGIARLPFNASAIERDLAFDAWEVTQAVQSLVNDVPLVANKPTYVRVFGRQDKGPYAKAVKVILHGERGGSPLPDSPLLPLNGVHSLSITTTHNRAETDAGWLFQLPDSWTDPGTTVLGAVVDPHGSYADPDPLDNFQFGAFAFTHKAPICPVFIPIRTHAPAASIDFPNFWPMINLAKQLLPASSIWVYKQDSDIAEDQICVEWKGICPLCVPVPYLCYGPFEMDEGASLLNGPADKDKIFAKLVLRDLLSDDPDECDAAGARTLYVGMVHPNTSGGPNGSARRNYDQLFIKLPPPDETPFDWRTTDRAATLSHEFGHSYDLAHVDCGGPDDPGPYPYKDPCKLDDGGFSAITTHFGFDINALAPIAPNEVADLMSYGHVLKPPIPRWTSDYTWKLVFDRLSGLAVAGAQPALDAASASPTGATNGLLPDLAPVSSIVLARGIVDPSLKQGYLEYAWTYPAATMSHGMLRKWQKLAAPMWSEDLLSSQAAVDYHLRLLGPDGTVLDERSITLVAAEDGDSEASSFALTFPAPAGEVARLELMADDMVLASLDPGLNEPSVNIMQPAGGEIYSDEMRIVWQASDADDDDDLLYSVQYSPDQGGTWLSLTTDFPGPLGSDTVTLTLQSLAGLSGSSTGGLVRVAASDGFHTGLATSQPFTVTDQPPEPYIVSPAPGEWVPAGRPVHLNGGARDAETGAVNEQALTWTVGGDDSGSGEEQWIAGLAPGSYDVDLTARDAAGQEATAQATLNVSRLAIPPAGAPALDGLCDDPAYAGAVAAGLRPYGDGSQATVHLLRSADYLWVCFTGLNQSATSFYSVTGLHVDADNSRDSLATAEDFGFFVSEDGTAFTASGAGAGGFTEAGPGGLLARVSANDTTWNAELRIEAGVLGGWGHLVGLDVVHTLQPIRGGTFHWPYAASDSQPQTWSETALGDLPEISDLEPPATLAASGAFTLTVNGTGFENGATVLWDEIGRPTTFISRTQLLAEIGANDIIAAGVAEVTVQSPTTDTFTSTPRMFVINNPVPTIQQLSPNATNSSTAFTLTVMGTGFVAGTTVLWDGEARPTMFVSGSELKAEIDKTNTVNGGAVGVTVLNPSPGGGGSNTVTFNIADLYSVFLPLLHK
jgi:hypothetical protein